jgi:hypothetical protein
MIACPDSNQQCPTTLRGLASEDIMMMSGGVSEKPSVNLLASGIRERGDDIVASAIGT